MCVWYLGGHDDWVEMVAGWLTQLSSEWQDPVVWLAISWADQEAKSLG